MILILTQDLYKDYSLQPLMLTADLALPQRHITALRDLSRNENIIFTTDKGGGGVVIDSTHL